MHYTQILLINLLIICSIQISSAQLNMSYGIKAGLNFSSIAGPKEMDAQNVALEEGGFVTGFHAGAILNIDIIENKFGIAPEFLFTQKGGKYRYNGLGSITLPTSSGALRTLQGQRKDAISITNSYINIPVLLYYKPVKRIKIGLGVDFGLLVGSAGSGETKFTWTDLAGQEQIVTLGLDYNYTRDKAGEAASETIETLEVDGGGTTLEFPTAIGAYYFNDVDNGNFYKTFDMGLDADFTFFLTKGISLGLRANYGLFDITNTAVDFSQQNPTETQADKDRNLSLQVSLGFNF